MSLEKLWTKDFIILFTISFLASLQFMLGITVMASYAIETFGSSASIAGLLSGVYVIGALFGRLGTGRVIEDLQSKRVLIIGSILYGITTALYLPTISLLFLIINRFMNGVFFGIVATAAATMIAQIIPLSRQGEGISYYTLNAILAMAIGPFLGILLVQYSDFRIIFVCNTIFAVISLILALVVQKPIQAAVKASGTNPVNRWNLAHFFEARAIPIASVSMIIGLVYSSILTFLPLYSAHLHLEKAASFFFAVYAVVILVSRPISGRLFDTRGANIVVYPSLLILAAGMLLYSQTNHAGTMLLAAAIIGLGYGNYHSCAQAISIKVTPPNGYGRATATYFAFYEVGLGGGPYVCGYIFPFIGWSNLYLMMAIVVMGALLLYYYVHGRREQQMYYRPQQELLGEVE